MIELKIVLDDTGHASVSGPIDNTLLSYGLLEIARDAIKAHAEQKKASAIIPANGVDVRALKIHQ
jgi:hypothetical protein